MITAFSKAAQSLVEVLGPAGWSFFQYELP